MWSSFRLAVVLATLITTSAYQWSCGESVVQKYKRGLGLDQEKVPQLVFEGRLYNQEEQTWPNKRLVILYLDGREVDRFVTKIGQSQLSGEGYHDGFFRLRAENAYRLGKADLLPSIKSRFIKEHNGNVTLWVEAREDALVYVSVPSKRKRYYIRSFGVPENQLPMALRQNTTKLRERQVFLSYKNRRPRRSDQIYVEDPKAQKLASHLGNTAVTLKETMAAAVEFAGTVHLATEVQEKPIRSLTSYAQNCKGSTPMRVELKEHQYFVKEYVLRADASVPVKIGALPLKLGVGAEHRNGKISGTSMKTSVEVPPNSKAEYRIEVRNAGKAFVLEAGGERIKLPIFLKDGLAFDHKLISVTSCV